MIPRAHHGGKSHRTSEEDRFNVPIPVNAHQDICLKCFNVLKVGGQMVCNYHGCRRRVPIQYVQKCPKGEF